MFVVSHGNQLNNSGDAVVLDGVGHLCDCRLEGGETQRRSHGDEGRGDC